LLKRTTDLINGIN